MLVSRVLPKATNNGNIVPTKVNTKRTGANPSFGFMYKPHTAKLIKEYLLPHEAHLFDQMMMHAVIMTDPANDALLKFNTDMVCKQAILRALQLRKWCRAKREDSNIPMPIALNLFAWNWNWGGSPIRKAA